MIKEIFIVQNVSTNNVEIQDFGLILPPDVSIDLANYDQAYLSEDVDTFLLKGDLVRIIAGNPVPYSDAFLSAIPNLIGPVSFADFYNSTNQLLSLTIGVYTDIQWDGTRILDSGDYTLLPGNTELQFEKDGKYLVMMRVTADQIGGNSRSDEKHDIQIDTGGGYTTVPGTLGYIYSRQTTIGRGGDTVIAILDVSSGTKIKGRGTLNAGGGDFQWPANGCSLTVTNIKGQPGLNGTDGTDGTDGSKGDQGIPGSGSTIGILDNGSFDGQYWNLNFKGATVSPGIDASTVDLDIGASIDVSIGIEDEGASIGSPVNIINFTGDSVSVVKNGNTADVSINHQTLPVYGTEYQLAASLAVSSSSATTPQTKVTLNTTSLPAGTYKITIGCMWRHLSASNDARLDMTLDGVSQGTTTTASMETKDINSWYPEVRSYYLTLSAGTHTLLLRYWNENNTTEISDATIELIRVE